MRADGEEAHVLEASRTSLIETFDLVMFDLDGVVYIGDRPVPHAAGAISRAREAGVHVAFVTNNAARPPQAVIDRLDGVGVEATSDDVVSSAQAAARMLSERHPPGSPIANVGTTGLAVALEECGLVPVPVDDESAVGIVSGYNPDLVWRDAMVAGVRIREGLPWVACNRDLTFPYQEGMIAPGHGVLVDLWSRFSGVRPDVAGKPSPPLLKETIARVGGDHPLMVGDRLDTDIEGAANVGVPSLLVLTGVTGLEELVQAAPRLRPTYLGSDLRTLFVQHPGPNREGSDWTCGGWRAHVDAGTLRVDRIDIPSAERDGSSDDWWRAASSAAWDWLDSHEEPVRTEGLEPPASAAAGEVASSHD